MSTDMRERIGELEKASSSLDRDIAVSTASFTILHKELSSKLVGVAQQNDSLRLENQSLKIELVKISASIEALKSRVEESDVAAQKIAQMQQRSEETSTKLKWGLITAISIAVINGIFAIIKGIL